jgi:hypothetical protein
MLRLGNYAYSDIALLIGVHVMMMTCNLWSLTRTDRDRVQGPVTMQVELYVRCIRQTPTIEMS